MNALGQVLGFWALLVAAYWVSVMDHTVDDVDVPLRRLTERQSWMYQFDPGLKSQLEVEP
jgi:hypothetical protein